MLDAAFTFEEKPDHALGVFDGKLYIGIIKKVANGWRFLKQGQRHISTPVLHSRTAVQDWLVATNGDVNVPYEVKRNGH
jgi:hypothetical protein